MNNLGYVILAAIVGLILGGCASSAINNQSSIVKALPQTIDHACAFYTTTKPQVVEFRDWAVKNPTLIPDAARPLLEQLDAHLKELDALGMDICSIDAILKAGASSGASSVTAGLAKTLKGAVANINIDTVLSTVLKVATTYAELKAQGVVH